MELFIPTSRHATKECCNGSVGKSDLASILAGALKQEEPRETFSPGMQLRQKLVT